MDAVSSMASGTPQLDEHVDDLCFTLALALRRILGVALPSEEEEDLDSIWEDTNDDS